MGRYKTYREPKRRGYDEESISGNQTTEVARYRHSSAPQASAPVEAVVKWFNAEKGFGFVAMADGGDAFIHIRQVEAAGHSSLPEGTRVKLRIGAGQKGPEVTEVIEIDVSAGSSSRARASTPSNVVGQVTESVGTVKLYKADKGFGFVGQDGGGKDVFVHVTALSRAGLSMLVEGQRVRMQIGQGQKGLEAQAIELLE
jgi:CspA family cold shock protein